MPVSRTTKVHGPSDSTPAPGRHSWERAPSEAQIETRHAALMLGHQGAAVRRLQELLNQAGASPRLEVDGKMGPATERAVVHFQRKHDLDDDGMAGRLTWRALKTATPATAIDDAGTAVTDPGHTTTATPKPLEPERSGITLRPPTDSRSPTDATGIATEAGRASAAFGRDRATRETQGEAILKANGQWPPAEGHLYVVQIDQDGPPAPTPVARGLTGAALRADQKRYNAEKQRVSDYLRHYTGQAVVFKAVNGRLVEQNTEGPLRSAAHPGQLSTTASPDVNGDGKSDIATLRSGVYQYHGHLNGSNRFDPVSDTAMKVARDLNHNGVIDADEARRNFTASGIQIHAGNSGGPSSIGCQTFEPNDYNLLVRAVKNAKVSTFTYVLVRRPNDQTGDNPL